MNSDQRNPYLVLGVPFGASREQATTAFALRSRRTRREPEFPYSIDDLTWALNQVEARSDDPAADVLTFRVPADVDVVKAPGGPGFLRMPPILPPRTTPPPTAEELQVVRDRALEEAVEALVRVQKAAILREYEPFLPVREVAFSGEPPRKRAWWVPFLVLVFVLLAVVGAVGIILSRQSGNGSPDASVAEEDTSEVPSAEQTTTTALLGPLVVYEPDGYDFDQWLKLDLSPAETGECFDVEGPYGTTVGTAVVVPCSRPHRFEFVSRRTVPDQITSFEDVETEIMNLCTWDFTVYVDRHPDESELVMWVTIPSRGGWPTSRDFECFLAAKNEVNLEGRAYKSGV